MHLRGPVRLFFEWDPLVALVNALGGHALYRGLLWSLIVLVPTLFLGRFFCGWICPMGTLQQWVSSWPSESKRGQQRIDSNRYKRWQTWKYALFLAGLTAAWMGSAAIGWFDPFSLLFAPGGWRCCPPSTLPCVLRWPPSSKATWAGSELPGKMCIWSCAIRFSISGSRTSCRACFSDCSSSSFSLPACA